MTIVQQAVVTLGWQMYWYKQLPYMEIIPYHLVIPLFLVVLDHDALSWWRIGECKDVWLWISTLLLCLITVAVLIFWSITVGGNHGHLQDILGEVMLSWRGVIFFSFWNAAVEEIEFRGFYLQALFVHYWYMREFWVKIGMSPILYRYIDWSITVPLQMIEFYLILSAVQKNISAAMFWRLLLGTVVMLAS